MRELILLRHAHAGGGSPGMPDQDRPLSEIGVAEARAAGDWLRAQSLLPDRILLSPSLRTRQTLAEAGALGDATVLEQPEIYEASVGELIALVDAHRDANRLLLVGHNPGLEQLVALLASGQSGDHRGMPPAAIAVLHLPADAEIEPGIASLSGFWWP